MRCLFIIPDLESGSGVCVKEVAQQLNDRGHSTIILTKYFQKSESLDIRAYSKYRNQSSPILRSIKRLLLYPVWPFLSYREIPDILKSTIEIIDNELIDIVISVYNPIESLYAAHIVKKRRNVMYIAYFLDALYAGQKPKLMPEFIKRIMALYWEKRVLSNADQVIMMKSAETVYEELKNVYKYLGVTKFLDLPLYKPCELIERDRKHFPKSQKVFLYAGALPNNIRDPHFFLDFFNKNAPISCHLYIAGSGDYDKLLNYYTSINKNIHILGRVAHEVVKEMYYEADYLINIGNSLRYMVPSKIFEYMSIGKPIIATQKINEDPSIIYLNEYPNALVLKENKEIDQIKKFSAFINKNHERVSDIDSFILNRPETFANCVERAYEDFIKE